MNGIRFLREHLYASNVKEYGRKLSEDVQTDSNVCIEEQKESRSSVSGRFSCEDWKMQANRMIRLGTMGKTKENATRGDM